ncbi:9150_t:CDS:2, partial [Acaulospora colombiana]
PKAPTAPQRAKSSVPSLARSSASPSAYSPSFSIADAVRHPPAYPFNRTFFRQRSSFMGGGAKGMNKYGIAPSENDIVGGNMAGWGASKEYEAIYPNSPNTAGRYGGYGTNGVGYGAAGVGAVAAAIGAGGRHLSTLDEKSSEGSRTPSALVQTTPVPDSMVNAAPGLLSPVDAKRPSTSLDARRLSAIPDLSLAVVNGDSTATPPNGAAAADGPRKLSVDTTADIARTLTPPSTAAISDPGSPAGGNHNNGTGHLNAHGKLSQAQQAVLAGLEQHAALLGVESPNVLGTETPAYSERHAYDGMEIYSPVSSAVTLSNRHSGLPYTMPSPPMPLTGLPPLPSHNPNNMANMTMPVVASSSPMLTGPPNIPLPPPPVLDTSVDNSPYNQSNNPFRTPPAENSDTEVNLAGRGANGFNHAA